MTRSAARGAGLAAASLILLAACWDSREGAGGGAPPSPAPPATAEAAAPQGTPLEPGQTKTAELTGGATAVYLLALVGAAWFFFPDATPAVKEMFAARRARKNGKS